MDGATSNELIQLAAAVVAAGIVSGLLAGLFRIGGGAMLLIVPTSVLAAPFGVRLAHRLSRRQLEVAFGLFLLVVAVRFALTLI